MKKFLLLLKNLDDSNLYKSEIWLRNEISSQPIANFSMCDLTDFNTSCGKINGDSLCNWACAIALETFV